MKLAPNSPFAKSRSMQFCFGPGECLYVDHRGHRVLADVEGEGTFHLVHVPDQVCISVDGIDNVKGSDQFHQFLTISTQERTKSQISVLLGSPPGTTATRITGQSSYHGCGWIVSSDHIATIDGDPRAASCLPQVHSVPFFQSATGKNLSISPVPLHLVPIGELSVENPASLEACDWQVKNPSKTLSLKSDLPGFDPLKAGVLSHLNNASWTVKKPAGCSQILIRRLSDAFHGRQRARVLVNNQFVGWWFEPFEDRISRWAWSQFGFECESAESVLRLCVDPAAGTPLWSVARYEIYGLFPETPNAPHRCSSLVEGDA